MFNLGALASSVLDSIDSVAKETLEEPKVSATAIRSKRKGGEPTNTLSQSNLSQLDQAGAISDKEGTNEFNTRQSTHGGSVLGDESIHSSHTQESYVLPSSPGGSQSAAVPVSEVESVVSAANSDKPPSISTSSLPFNLSSSSLPIIGQGSAKKAPPLPPTSLDSSEQQDLKKLLKKKNHEIENLNQECLELEEQTTSLKAEVQEAWDNYKQAQERAAVREAELLDEIKEIQSAKATDKQQSVQQFTKMQEDITLLSQQLQAQQEEKLTLKQQIADYEQLNETWEEKIRILKDDLQEARMGTIQGVQALRDELRLSQTQQEQMRVDHHNIVRQLQLRQEEMEREHQELANAMHSKEREIQRLKNSSGTSGNSQNSSGNDGEGDHMALQTELINTAKKLQQSEEAYEELQRLHKQLDRESKALQLNYDDEKDVNRRLTDSIRSLQQQVATLQVSGSEVNASTNTAQTSAGESASMSDVSDLKNQIEHLSKMLLKKQANVLELQAERSALKSRVTDLQTRANDAEQKLSRMKDLEDGLFDYEEDYGESPPPSGDGLNFRKVNTSTGMRKRGVEKEDTSYRRGTNRVLSDLEKIGVKPGVGVSKAVTAIDSWTMLTGRFLRHYPLMRLGFVFYLLILHLWVLFILVIQTHSLEDLAAASDPKQQLLN